MTINWLRESMEIDIKNYKTNKLKEEMDKEGIYYINKDYSNLEHIIKSMYMWIIIIKLWMELKHIDKIT